MSTPVPRFLLPRESVEMIALTPAIDGTPVTTYLVQAVPIGTRPTTAGWAAPATAGTDKGYLVTGLAVGRYGVWVKYTATPETPVMLAAQVHIT